MVHQINFMDLLWDLEISHPNFHLTCNQDRVRIKIRKKNMNHSNFSSLLGFDNMMSPQGFGPMGGPPPPNMPPGGQFEMFNDPSFGGQDQDFYHMQ